MQLDDIKPNKVRLHKTEKAHTILAKTCAATLSLPERRILILTNGERSLKDLTDELGHSILPAVQNLVHEGYLTAKAMGTPLDKFLLDPANRIGGLLRRKA
jgi:hypothetical protein